MHKTENKPEENDEKSLKDEHEVSDPFPDSPVGKAQSRRP
jgi:hypothetical protein